jgi:hypothetical protein
LTQARAWNGINLQGRHILDTAIKARLFNLFEIDVIPGRQLNLACVDRAADFDARNMRRQTLAGTQIKFDVCEGDIREIVRGRRSAGPLCNPDERQNPHRCFPGQNSQAGIPDCHVEAASSRAEYYLLVGVTD